jgi:hypothetical protein
LPNIASVLKEEIARLVRRQLRGETEGLKKASSHYRSEIATLKRRIEALEKQIVRLERMVPKKAAPAVDEESETKLRFKPQNGQFRTPRHVIRLMVEMAAPNAKNVICDPACGTCGFLVTAGEYLREKHPEILRDAQSLETFFATR